MDQWLPYYEVSGSGPCLLLLESGLSDANGSAAVAEALQDACTVVRIDRRGLSRSASRTPNGSIAGHADDVLGVLDRVAPARPAAIFGASIGALVALGLAQTAPERFSFIGVHEPPLEALVDWPERAAQLDEVASTAPADPMAAIEMMGRIVGSGDVREDDAPIPQVAGDMAANVATFLSSDFHAARQFRPHLDRLRGNSAIHVSAGKYTKGRFEHESARTLAGEASLPFEELAVGHSALTDFPRTTAAHLRVVALPLLS